MLEAGYAVKVGHGAFYAGAIAILQVEFKKEMYHKAALLARKTMHHYVILSDGYISLHF